MDDFLKNADPRLLASMLALVVVLTLVVEVKYLLWPQAQQYLELDDSLKVLRGAAGSSEGLEQQIELSRQQVEELSYRLHGDMAGLPAKKMESYVIGRLQKYSWDTDVELVSVVPGKGQTVHMFEETLFDVKIGARYLDFVRWLEVVNRELGYIVIKKFEISPRGKDYQNPNLLIALTLVSYRLTPTES
jgi:hypothetical protein